MKLAIIPAKGSSERIPNKNTIDFFGKPMLTHVIETVLATRIFDRVVVSTDSDLIARLATAAGAEAPFTRPAHLATAHCPVGPVVSHCIDFIEAQTGSPIELACCLYPTAVLITPDQLVDALRLFQARPQADYCFTVTRYAHPIQRSMSIDSDGYVTAISPENVMTRTQDFEARYHDAGQFYFGRRDAMLGLSTPQDSVSIGYPLRYLDAIDIDDHNDLELARAIYAARSVLASGKPETPNRIVGVSAR